MDYIFTDSLDLEILLERALDGTPLRELAPLFPTLAELAADEDEEEDDDDEEEDDDDEEEDDDDEDDDEEDDDEDE